VLARALVLAGATKQIDQQSAGRDVRRINTELPSQLLDGVNDSALIN